VLITPVGVDEPGNWFMSEARRLNIECVSFITPKKATAKKVRVRAKGQQLVRLDYEDASTIPADEIPYTLMSCIFSHILLSDIVILSDYAKGLFSVNRLKEIIAFCYKNNRIVIADPKPKNGLGYFGASYITPNSHEMLNMMPGFADPNNAAMAYSVQMNCSVLLTKGAEGLSLITGGQVIKNWPTQAKEVFDVTGAGDTVIAAFALALASGATEEEACVFANKAAGVVVGKHGTSTVNLEEIR
jgi:D-beta-D-heptose 7-phosphate kinase/D-beta-D-heptose 1-phosphate adenosyltransferase